MHVQHPHTAVQADPYTALAKPQLDLSMQMAVMCYYQNGHFHTHRSDQTGASVIHYLMDSVPKAMYPRAKHTISRKPDILLLEVRNLALLSNL